MTPVMVVALVLGALGTGLIVGVTLGLYLGERGRRVTAERWVATGSPVEASARRIPAPASTEEMVTAPILRTVQSHTAPAGAPTRLAAWLRKRAAERGVALTEADALAHAEGLVASADEVAP